MKIKNSFELDPHETAELFYKLAESLKLNNSLDFEIKGNAASLEVGELLSTQLSFSETSFSLQFKWGKTEVEKEIEEEKGVDWRSQFDQDMQDAGLTVDEEKALIEELEPIIEEEMPIIEEPSLPKEETTPTPSVPLEPLPTRMVLGTTTLSYDPGYWTSSFSLDESTNTWDALLIGEDLENKKWDVDNDENISAPSIAPARQVRRSVEEDDDDDLFSDLDKLDEKSPMKRETKVINRKKHVKVSISGQAIPSAKEILDNEQIENWSEPTPEDNTTNDDWVKPSEVLQKKNKEAKNKPTPIPGPIIPTSTPKPKKDVKKEKSELPTPSKSSNEILSEVSEWKEPEDVTSDEDSWVKPSEFAKIQKKPKKDNIPTPDKSKDPRFKEPPEAPDKKKNDKKDKKNKGWASW